MNILKVLTERRKRGNLGERLAARHLKKNGYKILERNYADKDAEIDIISKKEDTLVFVEVKARTVPSSSQRESRPASAVTPEKQKKIIRLASHYIRSIRHSGRVRFDVIEVYLTNKNGKDRLFEIKHLINTFDLNSAYRPYRS